MRSPLLYFGGKGHLVKKLVPLIPKHRRYVEVFGGAASLLFAKEPSSLEVLNDLDSRLVNFYRILRDTSQYKEMVRLAELTPYSREENHTCREKDHPLDNEVLEAWRYFTLNRQCYSGTLSGWAFARNYTRCGMSATVSRYLSAVEGLPAFHTRLRTVQVEHDDWRNILDRYDTSDTFFYLDPPYVHSARKRGRYRHELNDEDHAELVNRIQTLKGKVLLSGYDNPIYKPLDKRWEKRTFSTVCRVRGSDQKLAQRNRTEVVWANYHFPKDK